LRLVTAIARVVRTPPTKYAPWDAFCDREPNHEEYEDDLVKEDKDDRVKEYTHDQTKELQDDQVKKEPKDQSTPV
jgi:hypothetical protein